MTLPVFVFDSMAVASTSPVTRSMLPVILAADVPSSWAPSNTILASFMPLILTGWSLTPGMPKPWTVFFVKLTMMPMEIGAGFASFASFILSVVVPSHASVNVVSAARAVIGKQMIIAVRAMTRQQDRSIAETPAGPTLAAYHDRQEAVRTLFRAGGAYAIRALPDLCFGIVSERLVRSTRHSP